ncbi:MAG: hypothetical protein HY876_09835 [Coriobacteriales bacterium]|nr:hypothetical protein [Coriobacteriales bacterium]
MPLWAWIAIGAGVVALLAGIGVAAVFGYRAFERRFLVNLVGKREAVTAVAQSLEGVVARLAESDDQTIETFADDPESVERHVLTETAQHARELSEELDTQPMPRRLVPVAEALADAAYVVYDEAGKVQVGMRDEEALDALTSIDLGRIRQVFAAARSELHAACEICRFEDESIYGGGLYL